MSDYCERIVDVEVSGEEAPAVAKRMVDWMIEEGLITREMSDDGVYSWGVDEGYLPGPNWKRAVTDHSEDSWAPGPVAILVGREHHIDGSLGEATASSATCPRCANKTVIINDPDEIDLDEIDSDEIEPDEEAWRPFSDGIEAWQETGKGHVACPSCGEAVSVTEWQFE